MSMRYRGWESPRFAAAFVLSAMLLGACAGTPDEARLRAEIDAMQLAVQERRAGEFMERVTDDFVGRGGLDRAALHNLLRAQMLRNASIGVTRGPVEIKIQGDRASADFSVVLTGGAGGLIPERAQAYEIKTGWRIEDDAWRLFLAEWEPAL